jgi:protein phosphatase methylesterase 1
MSDLQRKCMKSNLPPRVPIFATAPVHIDQPIDRTNKRKKRDFSVIPWTNYFDRAENVETEDENKFRVYVKGNSGPAFLFLHGGGFSGLSWALLCSRLVEQVKCQCYALDLRGHGKLTYSLEFF